MASIYFSSDKSDRSTFDFLIYNVMRKCKTNKGLVSNTVSNNANWNGVSLILSHY